MSIRLQFETHGYFYSHVLFFNHGLKPFLGNCVPLRANPHPNLAIIPIRKINPTIHDQKAKVAKWE